MIGAVIDFFAGGPARLKGLLVGAAVGLVALLTVVAIALWWRGEAYQARAELEKARGERDLAIAQSKILAKSVQACSDGVELAKRSADSAVKLGVQLLAAAKKEHQGARQQADRIEDLMKRPPPDGAGCEQAWDAIEDAIQRAQPKARTP